MTTRRAGQRRAWLARAGVAVVFVAAVVAVLGPSLRGTEVALPHDLHLQQLPWSAAGDVEAHNVELRDLIDQYYPTQAAITERAFGDGDGTWLPDVGLGFPGWEFVGWGAVSPFTVLPALALPFDLAWSWGQGLRLLAAMGGAYLLTRTVGAGRAGAAVAGLAFGLSGFVVGWLGWPQSHVAAAAPWVWWAAERTAGAGTRWWAPAALAGATLAVWLGGFPAASVFVLMGAGAVAVAAALRTGAPWTRLAVAGVAVAAGTAAAAFTLLPSVLLLDDLDLSARADAWRSRAFPVALWSFVAPRMYGGAPTDIPRWITQANVEIVAYVGVTTLLLAALAWALGPRRRAVAVYTAVAFAFGAMAYGFPPVQWLVAHTPVLATNPPNRALVVVALAAAVVGGLGADAAARWITGEVRWRRRGALGAAAVIAAFAAWGVERVATGTLRAHAVERLGDGERLAAAVAGAGRWLAVAAALLAAAVALVAGARWLARRAPAAPLAAVLGAALVTLVAVDLLGTWAVGWNTQVPRASLFPDAPGLDALRDADGRVAGAGAGHPNTHLVDGFADVRAHAFLTPRQRAVLDAMDADLLSPTRWTLDTAAAPAWRPWLSVLGVERVLAAGGDPPPGWRREAHGPVEVWHNPAARPPVAALTDVDLAGDDPLADVAARPVGTAARAALVEPAAGSPLTPGDLPGEGAARILAADRDGARVTAVVDSPDGALVATDQAALPGWRARVDRARRPVVTVDGLFAGVLVDAGRHEVTLAYVTPGRTAGRALSAVGLLATAGLLIAGWRRRGRPGPGR